ncbi:hypothetical protein [Streptomyces anulatus]|uniref:hypothetical protein n=1 Tax=Streptomyces anulatus TaxID=1892 RepID=UPI003686BC09
MPRTLAPGDSYATCVTYVLPKSVGVLSLTHHADGFLDEGGTVATWPVEGGLEAVSAGLREPDDVVRVRWDARENGLLTGENVLELPAGPPSVSRGRSADLAGLDLDFNENERRGVPYYVSVTCTNPGPEASTPTRSAASACSPRAVGRSRGRPPSVSTRGSPAARPTGSPG